MMTLNKNQTTSCSPASLPGLQLRPWREQADFQLALDIYNAERELGGIALTFTLKDFENDVEGIENFDIHQQYVFAESHGHPVGFVNFNWEQQTDGTWVIFFDGSLLPAFYQTEIAETMLNYMESKARELMACIPPEQPRVLRGFKRRKNQQALEFFLGHGFSIERYFCKMRRPIDLPLEEHPLPPGIEIRPVTPEHYRKIWDASQEAFRDHWGYVPPIEQSFQTWQQQTTFQPHLWKVAWEGEQVAGMVQNFIREGENQEFNRRRGYTEGISVCRPWRGKGLAKALIAESIRMFKAMGMDETYLSVDAENSSGALRLYSSMGYQELPDETSLVYQKVLD